MKKLMIVMLMMGSTLFAGTINIAVAANVGYAMDELKAAFKKTHPHTNVRITLGGSGKLTAQIGMGAPFGLFMSADMKYPQNLYDKKIAIDKPMVYAQGGLAYFSVKPRAFEKGILLLKQSAIRKIAIGNPVTAPYGKASVEALKNAHIYGEIKHKFVYAESISQVVTYTMTAVDIGLVAKSSLYSKAMQAYKEGVHWMSVDTTLYKPIKQGIVLLKRSKKNSEYKAFYDFILSKKAKNILKRYGYII